MDGSQMSLSKPVEINVKKNNGITERFSYEKLLKSLVMVEVPFFESDKIIADVVSQLHEGITTKEIKKIVYENFCSLFKGLCRILFIVAIAEVGVITAENNKNNNPEVIIRKIITAFPFNDEV